MSGEQHLQDEGGAWRPGGPSALDLQQKWASLLPTGEMFEAELSSGTFGRINQHYQRMNH